VPFPSDAGNTAEKHARPELYAKTGLLALAETTPMMIAASRSASVNQPRTRFKDDLRFTTDSRFLQGAEKADQRTVLWWHGSSEIVQDDCDGL
jgi:hypothetical protein